VKTFLCPTEADTEAAGREIARALPRDAVVHLIGELGARKNRLRCVTNLFRWRNLAQLCRGH